MLDIKKGKIVTILCLSFLAVSGLFAAEDIALRDLMPQKNAEKHVSVSEEYTLRKGDKISITIYPTDEYIRGGAMQISPQGTITLPLLGQIKLEGLRITEAQEKLAELLNEDYLVDPNVVIEVNQFKQQSFIILGQVKSPGTFQFPPGENRLTFLQAISIAGGFSEIANIKKIKIIREEGGKKKVTRINAEKVISGDSPDVEIHPNDIIHVSESLF